MIEATKGKLIVAGFATIFVVILSICFLVEDKDRGIIVREAPAEKQEPKPDDRLQEIGAGWTSNVYIIRDTVTGREFLVNYKGGIVEILPVGK